jgi:hypothetical protein
MAALEVDPMARIDGYLTYALITMKELQSRRSFWVERRCHLWPAVRVNIGQGKSPRLDYILLHKSWFGRLVCWDIQVRLQQLDTPTTNIDKPANQAVAHILLHLICLSNIADLDMLGACLCQSKAR